MAADHFDEFCSLMWRAALQDWTAEIASEVAEEAERTAGREAAEIAWMIAHRNRLHALKLQAQAEACRRSGGSPSVSGGASQGWPPWTASTTS